MSQAQNLGKLANNVSADGRILSSGLVNAVSISNGGFGSAVSVTAGSVFCGLGVAGIGSIAGGTSGQVLISQGSANPIWGASPAAEVTQLASASIMGGFNSFTISPLMLTTYKFLYLYFVNLNCMFPYSLTIGSASLSSQSNTTSSMGMIMLDLINNACSATSMRVSGSGAAYMSGTHNVSQFTTSITVSCGATTFTSGNYILYGQPYFVLGGIHDRPFLSYKEWIKEKKSVPWSYQEAAKKTLEYFDRK